LIKELSNELLAEYLRELIYKINNWFCYSLFVRDVMLLQTNKLICLQGKG